MGGSDSHLAALLVLLLFTTSVCTETDLHAVVTAGTVRGAGAGAGGESRPELETPQSMDHEALVEAPVDSSLVLRVGGVLEDGWASFCPKVADFLVGRECDVTDKGTNKIRLWN